MMDGLTTSVVDRSSMLISDAIDEVRDRVMATPPTPAVGLKIIEISLGPRPIEDFDKWWRQQVRGNPAYNLIHFRAHDAVPIAERTLRPETDLRRIADRLTMLGITNYSCHPPDKKRADLDGVKEWFLQAWREFADRGIKFAVETMYYNRHREHNLVSYEDVHDFATWARGLHFYQPLVLDLAHLRINVRAGQWTEPIQMLGSESTWMEVHVSSNDGRRDLHRPYDPTVDEDIRRWLTYIPPTVPRIGEGRAR